MSPTTAPESTDGQQPPAAAVRRRLPPWPLRIAVLVMLALVVVFRNLPDIDVAVVNIATFVLCTISSFLLVVWFVWRSGYPRAARFGLLAVLVVAASLFFGMLRIDQFDGSLVPTFRPRWETAVDRLLPSAAPISPEPQANLVATTDHDFPRFLGAASDSTIPGVELAHDWDRQPPEQLWRQPIGAGWSAFALVGPYAVTLEQRGPEELVTCYEIETGKLVWVQATATRHESTLGGIGPRSTPTIYDGKVYAQGATGRLHCLDGASGQVLWEKDLLKEFGVASPEADMDAVAWGRSGSPLIVDNLVVVPAGGPHGGPYVSLVAYDRQTGGEVWRGGTSQISYASPSLVTLGGVPTIVSVNESNITGHDPQTGAVRWTEDWPGSSNSSATNSQTVALDEHRLFVSKGYGGGSRVFEVTADGDTWRTADVWSKPRNLQTKLTNVVRRGGFIFGLSEGILECVNETNGERAWKKSAGRFGHGQILLIGDTLLVLSETGELALVAAVPDDFVKLASRQALEGKTWNNPAFSSPHLLIRNGQEAACFRLPLAGPTDAGAADASPAADSP